MTRSLILGMVAVPLLVAPAGAGTLWGTAVEDVYIVSNDPANPHDDTSRVSVGVYARSHPGPTRAGLLQFTLPALPAGEVVTAATVTGFSTFTGNVPDCVIVGLATNPSLAPYTWNMALADGVITGRDATDYHVLWGPNATEFLGERWSGTGLVLKQPTTYTDTTPADGLLKMINDTISTGGPTTITLGFGGPPGDSDYGFSFFSLEAWNNDANPTPGIFTPTLELTTEPGAAPIPEPATLGLLCLGAAGLLARRSRP